MAKKYFSGVVQVLQNAPKSSKRGFWGPQTTPKKYFFPIFQHFINLFGHSAFQRAFTRYFKCPLSRFMMFSIKLGFLAENLAVLHSKIYLKIAFFQMRNPNLKWL